MLPAPSGVVDDVALIAVNGFVRIVVAAATELLVAEADAMVVERSPEVGVLVPAEPQPMPATLSINATAVRTAALFGTRLAKTPGPILPSPSPRKP